jgi:hypothetical protein
MCFKDFNILLTDLALLHALMLCMYLFQLNFFLGGCVSEARTLKVRLQVASPFSSLTVTTPQSTMDRESNINKFITDRVLNRSIKLKNARQVTNVDC